MPVRTRIVHSSIALAPSERGPGLRMLLRGIGPVTVTAINRRLSCDIRNVV
jgi:hypothetical protein